MQVKGTRIWCMLVEYAKDNYYTRFYDPSYHTPQPRSDDIFRFNWCYAVVY